ncbi:hypothetical protein [Stutzerimonas stutzeri]|uniref:Uncharacterized protein n=1 Tax=Stutzerimonas stutzeri TaxID=316 RepID=A0AA42PA38_STUST|nr:hypothetical protein [Stutzerimonas stutzeri]MDH1236515.1 hypothetical protein [Stutzerimonas stutzeri]
MNTQEDLVEVINSALESWHAANTPEAIREKVHKSLDNSSKEVVLKLLGFNNRWSNGWELDHCNGRNGNSVIGEYLKKTQEQILHEWFAKIPLPELTKMEINNLGKNFASQYKDAFRNYIARAATKKAEADAQALIDSLSPSKFLDNFMQLQQLLTPKEESNEQPASP